MAGKRSSTDMAAPTRSQGRPSLAEAEAIDRNLRHAAMAALLEQGDGATMNGIAQSAGISRKALYARYSGRSDLFADVIREMLAEVEPLPVAREGTVRERLSTFIVDALQLLAQPRSRAVQRLIALNPFYLGSLHNEMREATAKMFFDPLLGLVEEAIAEGLTTQRDARAVATVVLRMIFSQGLFESGEDKEEANGNPVMAGSHAKLVLEIIVGGLLGS